ncbi:hypothetical protein Ddye_024463 [Dipteronia dyeriana]|uniref:ABC transmembrane type-1 domain-containing protein n=1 Tax=Dipteronia dyeriana TaxID=168575 RepID=A0AAD9TVR7_9ROSI|nr:hypothetical protein Ddye_024463 [Dipteronia dyeriana]
MGAYSQLVRLQEGAKGAGKAQVTGVDKSNASSSQMDEAMARRHRRRPHRGSSSGHHSFGFDVGVASFSIYETQAEEAVEEKNEISEIEIEKAKKVSIKRLAYLNKPEIPVLLIGAFAAVIDAVILPIFALIISTAIKMFFEPPHQLQKESKMWSVVFMRLSLISLIATPLKSYFFGMAGGKLIERIRSLTFEKVVHQQISWFDDPANSRSVY